MAVKRWTPIREQFFDANGDPLNGGKLFFYAAGSSTKQDTFNSSAGSVANSNPLVLDAAGRPGSEIWMTTGQTYKVVLTSSTDGDPPSSPTWTEDVVAGINDASLTLDEWVTGPAPTYVSSTSFTVVGDQTSTLTVGRRVKITDAGGTKYGTIKTSAFTTLTTLTLDSQDSDALVTPTSALSYGLFNPTNTSHPVQSDALAIVGGSADRSKRLRFEVDGFTTANTRVATPPNYDHRIMPQTHGADIASAATIDLDAATGDLVDVTGTTTITAITLANGRAATVRFTGALTLTNGASLLLPGAANITTVAGDVAMFRGYAAGVVRCVSFMSIGAAAIAASQTEQEAASSTTRFVAPGRQHFHPSAAKGWAQFTIAGAVSASYNVTSVTDVGVGQATVTWATDFSSGTYSAIVTAEMASGTVFAYCSSPAVGSIEVTGRNTANTLTDPATGWFIAAFGDQ